MKSQLLVVLIVGLCAVALCSPAVAGEDEDSKARFQKRGPRAGGMHRGHDPVVLEIRFAEELRKVVMSELELDEAQRTTITELFTEHIKAVKQVASEHSDNTDRKEQWDHIRELEQQAHAAREAGDHEEARRIRKEIRRIRQKELGRDMPKLGRMSREFLARVSAQLTEEQVQQFRRLMRQVRSENTPVGPLVQFMRSVRHTMSDLELNGDQRKAISKLVREAMAEIDQPRENPNAVDELMERLRPELRSELGEELGKKFIEALEEVQQKIKASEKAHREGETPSAKPAEEKTN